MRITNRISVSCTRFHLNSPKSCFQSQWHTFIYYLRRYFILHTRVWLLTVTTISGYVCVDVVAITAKVLNQLYLCEIRLSCQLLLFRITPFLMATWETCFPACLTSSFQLSLITSSCVLKFLSITDSGKPNLSFITAFTMGNSQFPGILHPVCHTQLRSITVRWAAWKWHLSASAPSISPCLQDLHLHPAWWSSGLIKEKAGWLGQRGKETRIPWNVSFAFLVIDWPLRVRKEKFNNELKKWVYSKNLIILLIYLK